MEEAEKEIQAERERMERAVQEQAGREKELERLKMDSERQVCNSIVSLSGGDKDRK